MGMKVDTRAISISKANCLCFWYLYPGSHNGVNFNIDDIGHELILCLNHDGRNDLAGVGKQEKYMVEGTEWLDHDGMEADNQYVSIHLTGMAALS